MKKTKEETSANVSPLTELIDSVDVLPHLLIDVAGRGLGIADALDSAGIQIIRVRKKGDVWSPINP